MGWSTQVRDGVEGLECAWTLAGFAAIRAAVVDVMDLADRLDHHPEVTFGYRTLSVRWTTHDCGGISDLDRLAAEATDALIAALTAPA